MLTCWAAGWAGSELPPLKAPVRALPTTCPTAEPTATPAAVDAICAIRPGWPDGAVAGAAAEGGGCAGRWAEGAAARLQSRRLTGLILAGLLAEGPRCLQLGGGTLYPSQRVGDHPRLLHHRPSHAKMAQQPPRSRCHALGCRVSSAPSPWGPVPVTPGWPGGHAAAPPGHGRFDGISRATAKVTAAAVLARGPARRRLSQPAQPGRGRGGATPPEGGAGPRVLLYLRGSVGLYLPASPGVGDLRPGSWPEPCAPWRRGPLSQGAEDVRRGNQPGPPETPVERRERRELGAVPSSGSRHQEARPCSSPSYQTGSLAAAWPLSPGWTDCGREKALTQPPARGGLAPSPDPECPPGGVSTPSQQKPNPQPAPT